MKLKIKITDTSIKLALDTILESFNQWQYRTGDMIFSEHSSHWTLTMELGDFATFWKFHLEEKSDLKKELKDRFFEALEAIYDKKDTMSVSLELLVF